MRSKSPLPFGLILILLALGYRKWGKLLDPERPSPPATARPVSPLNVNLKQKNSEVLQEIFRVTYNRQPPDWNEFQPLMNALAQGASFEGIYNGLIHSVTYRKLESSAENAPIAALDQFARQLAQLERELTKKTLFLSETKSYFPEPDRVPAAQASELGDWKLEGSDPIQSVRAVSMELAQRHYVSLFGGASIYLLKRTLGEEAIRVITQKACSKELLAQWYGDLAARLAQEGVDFGLSQRNQTSPQYHYKWAIENSNDSLSWEVLNRYHRLLNAAENTETLRPQKS